MHTERETLSPTIHPLTSTHHVLPLKPPPAFVSQCLFFLPSLAPSLPLSISPGLGCALLALLPASPHFLFVSVQWTEHSELI